MSLEERLLHALVQHRLSLALAESCTGGMVAARITRVPGAGDHFLGGVVTYTDAAKETLLGVPHETLRELGAVSADVARAMALSVRDLLRADIAVSVTGFAGPSVPPGGELGLVFLAVAQKGGVKVHEMRYGGGREEVREAATQDALALALEAADASSQSR